MFWLMKPPTTRSRAPPLPHVSQFILATYIYDPVPSCLLPAVALTQFSSQQIPIDIIRMHCSFMLLPMVESTVKSIELVAEEMREDRYIVAPHTGHTLLLGASVAYLLSFIDCYDKNICDVSQFFFVLLPCHPLLCLLLL